MVKKPVLIVENCTSGLTLNEKSEHAKTGKFLMEGVFTEFDVKNRNDRIYSSTGFLPHLDELLERKKQLGVIYGEFDHPDVFDTSLSRVSHVIENAWYNKDANRIDGQIVLLNTHWGKEAKSIVQEGYPVFVSSRAAGVTDSVGQVELKKLFTYDCVADPGFSSAKMSMKSVNESVGLTDKSNVHMYEAPEQLFNKYSKVFDLSNETKTNELFEMNKNDLVTKNQLTQYSDYLVNELNSTKTAIQKIIKEDKTATVNKTKLEDLSEYYEALDSQNSKVVEYLDYLASKMQHVVAENVKLTKEHKALQETTKVLENKATKLEKENKTMSNTLDKSIEYQNYLAENLDKNISYAEYLAENLDKNISYSEYLAENLDKNISYSEYLAENLDKNISYSEYLAENLDKNISYSEYIADNLNTNIKYSEYLAENLDISIKYQEYIAENLDKDIKYTEYIAECADNTMSYAGNIAKTLNENKESINEGVHIQSPTEFLKGGSKTASGSEDELKQKVKVSKLGSPTKTHKSDMSTEGTGSPKLADKADIINTDKKFLDGTMETGAKEGEIEKKHKSSGQKVPKTVTESVNESAKFTTGSLTSKIDTLITEAKKRKASLSKEPHFYKFLNRSQIKAYEGLNADEQETIKVALNESSYYSASDILKTMREVLNAKQVSPEEKLLAGMPKETQKLWESLDSNTKQSVVSQSKFYVLDTEDKIENFWKTRKLATKSLNEAKTLIQQDELQLNDSLSKDQVDGFMERFNRLK